MYCIPFRTGEETDTASKRYHKIHCAIVSYDEHNNNVFNDFKYTFLYLHNILSG